MKNTYILHLLICTLALVAHTVINVITNTSSKQTYFTSDSKTLTLDSFPFILKLYIMPAFNISQLQSVGYDNLLQYFKGARGDWDNQTDIFMGWTGNTSFSNQSGV